MTADTWADYADVAAGLNGNSLIGEPEKYLQAALSLDPQHPKALWLEGSLQHETGQYAQAVATWQKLAEVLGPDSPDAKVIAANLAEDQRLAGPAPAARDRDGGRRRRGARRGRVIRRLAPTSIPRPDAVHTRQIRQLAGRTGRRTAHHDRQLAGEIRTERHARNAAESQALDRRPGHDRGARVEVRTSDAAERRPARSDELRWTPRPASRCASSSSA